MFAFHVLFFYGSCALLRVKMESIYIYSVFIWGRHGGLVECLSYWHTCCVSSESTESQWLWLGKAVFHAALYFLSIHSQLLILLVVDITMLMILFQVIFHIENNLWVLLKVHENLVLMIVLYLLALMFGVSSCALNVFVFFSGWLN